MIAWLLAVTLLTPFGILVCGDRICPLSLLGTEAVLWSQAEYQQSQEFGVSSLILVPILLTRNHRHWGQIVCPGLYRRDDPMVLVCDVYLEIQR